MQPSSTLAAYQILPEAGGLALRLQGEAQYTAIVQCALDILEAESGFSTSEREVSFLIQDTSLESTLRVFLKQLQSRPLLQDGLDESYCLNQDNLLFPPPKVFSSRPTLDAWLERQAGALCAFVLDHPTLRRANAVAAISEPGLEKRLREAPGQTVSLSGYLTARIAEAIDTVDGTALIGPPDPEGSLHIRGDVTGLRVLLVCTEYGSGERLQTAADAFRGAGADAVYGTACHQRA